MQFIFLFMNRRLWPLGAPLAVLTVTLLLAGCVGLTPPKQQTALQNWLLDVTDPQVIAADIDPVVLRMVEIDAPTALDTTAMAYIDQPNQLSFYRDNRWAAPPAEMIQQSLKTGFERQQWVKAVLLGSERLDSDLIIACDLDRLEHHVISETQGAARLTISCDWVDTQSREVKARSVFQENKPLAENNAAAFVAASQLLLEQISDQLIGQTLEVAQNLKHE